MARIVHHLLNITTPHWNIMNRLFSAGWTGARVQSYMSGNGMGYRKSTILAARRNILGILKHEEMFQKWTTGAVVHKGYFEEIEFTAPFKYRINYWLDCTDSITGQVTTQSRTALFDTFIDPEQIAPEILARLNTDRYEQFSEFANVVVRNVEHQAGAPY